jgi:hypothetical protein
MDCAVNVVLGELVMKDSLISLDGINKQNFNKVPCLTCMTDSSISIFNCSFKGDQTHEVYTAGILCINPKKVFISNSLITFHKAGGIIMSLCSNSEVNINENQIYQCETSGIYV